MHTSTATRCEKLRLFIDSINLVQQYESLCREHNDLTESVQNDMKARKSLLDSKIKKSTSLVELNRVLQNLKSAGLGHGLADGGNDPRRLLELYEQIGDLQM